MDHVLYFVSARSPSAARTAEAALNAAARRASPHRARQVRIQLETSVPRLLAKLRAHGADALVIDARGELGSVEEGATLSLLRALFGRDEVGGPIGRAQTWLVVDRDDRGVALSFEAGRARVAGTLAISSDDEGFRQIWERIDRTTARRQGGKIALCLAGGGFEGLLYELGALRALSHFLPDTSLGDVDILCGISAGAILGAFLANGLSPREIARGLQFGEGRLDKISRSELFDPNLGEMASRTLRVGWEALRGKQSPLSAAFRAPPAGLFAGTRLLRYLERQLAKPGMTDSFERLRRQLFIGATDLDTAEHVVFGDEGQKHVPISAAARASAALTPFYAPLEIGGRHYVDGGFTRTTNMRAAVQAGATLVILIDPVVPLYSEQPGYVANKGGVFAALQGLKTLIHARFDKAIPTLREMYPDVSFHLFQPDGRIMKAMSGSPMKYFYRSTIEELAFRDTLRDIRTRRFDALARDFERHDVRFEDPDTAVRRDTFDYVRVA